MPYYYPTDYTPLLPFRNGHLQTVWPALLRIVPDPAYEREQVELNDGDFIHLDWSCHGSESLAVLCHGMEGNAEAGYMKAMACHLKAAGWDVVAYNFRGCSGVPNRLLRGYHSGDTADLDTVLQYIHNHYNYAKYVLAGFSLGGNVVLKYAGEKGSGLLPEKVAAVSVPCHLASCAEKMSRWFNRLYLRRFLNDFYRKLKEKEQMHPGLLPVERLKNMRNFRDLDTYYTAPFHGFSGPEEYWGSSSCLYWLPEIRKPALLINADDDPFLSDLSYPVETARNNPALTFLHSRYGGHMGFVQFGKNGRYWYEDKIIKFFTEKAL